MTFCEEQIGVDLNVKGYQVFVKSLTPEEKVGSLFIPEYTIKEAQKRLEIGLILAVGPIAFDERHISRKCDVGQYVIYSALERTPLRIRDHLCYFINDDKIQAQISEEVAKELLVAFLKKG